MKRLGKIFHKQEVISGTPGLNGGLGNQRDAMQTPTQTVPVINNQWNQPSGSRVTFEQNPHIPSANSVVTIAPSRLHTVIHNQPTASFQQSQQVRSPPAARSPLPPPPQQQQLHTLTPAFNPEYTMQELSHDGGGNLGRTVKVATIQFSNGDSYTGHIQNGQVPFS